MTASSLVRNSVLSENRWIPTTSEAHFEECDDYVFFSRPQRLKIHQYSPHFDEIHVYDAPNHSARQFDTSFLHGNAVVAIGRQGEWVQIFIPEAHEKRLQAWIFGRSQATGERILQSINDQSTADSALKFQSSQVVHSLAPFPPISTTKAAVPQMSMLIKVPVPPKPRKQVCHFFPESSSVSDKTDETEDDGSVQLGPEDVEAPSTVSIQKRDSLIFYGHFPPVLVDPVPMPHLLHEEVAPISTPKVSRKSSTYEPKVWVDEEEDESEIVPKQRPDNTVGIGLWLEKRKVAGGLCSVVRAVVPDFAACRSAEIIVGDIIESIDGIDVSPLSLQIIRGMCIGPVGSRCAVRLRRETRRGAQGFTLLAVRLVRVVPASVNESNLLGLSTFKVRADPPPVSAGGAPLKLEDMC